MSNRIEVASRAGAFELSRRNVLRAGLSVGALAVGGSFLAACGGGNESAPGAGDGTPKSGGVLRLGFSGGSASDTLDPLVSTTAIDFHRAAALYDNGYWPDADFVYQPSLVEEATSNADASVWTIRLRSGVEFHNGKTMTADDFIYTVNRIFELPYSFLSGRFKVVDVPGITKVDDLTVTVPMTTPFSIFPNQLSQLAILPVGFDPEKPVGTGPFMFKSFAPGRESVFVRNPNWWGGPAQLAGAPYLDELQILDFSDDTARVNALIANQVDGIDAVPYVQAQVLTAQRMQMVDVPTGNWRPFTMRVDLEPFSDPRVREAMRLIVDRPGMIQQALNGFGTLGNDVYSPQDPNYAAANLPQRVQDIPKAQSLLKSAGYPDLTVELTTSPVAAGVVEASTVFATEAKKAGVTINVKKVDSGTFYGQNYLSWPFAVDWWTPLPYLDQAVTADGPTAALNETHWNDPEFTSNYYSAMKEPDAAKRAPFEQEMMRIQHERGGYIIWGFANTVDAHSSKVHGLTPTKYGQSWGDSSFWRIWVD